MNESNITFEHERTKSTVMCNFVFVGSIFIKTIKYIEMIYMNL